MDFHLSNYRLRTFMYLTIHVGFSRVSLWLTSRGLTNCYRITITGSRGRLLVYTNTFDYHMTWKKNSMETWIPSSNTKITKWLVKSFASQQINWTAWKITWNVAELSRPFVNFFYFWSGLLLHRKCKELWELSNRQNCIQWISSQPLSLLLNNQLYPLASCPLDK